MNSIELNLNTESKTLNNFKWRPTNEFNEAIKRSENHFGYRNRSYIVRAALRAFRSLDFKHTATISDKLTNSPITLKIKDTIEYTGYDIEDKQTKFIIEGIVIAWLDMMIKKSPKRIIKVTIGAN